MKTAKVIPNFKSKDKPYLQITDQYLKSAREGNPQDRLVFCTVEQ